MNMTRHDRLIQEKTHDPYFMKEKSPGPSVCTKCSVALRDGVFEWRDPGPEDAREMVCPACKRIDDDYAGGQVVLEGAFLKAHEIEAMNIIKNTERSERSRRPLERVISVTAGKGEIEVKTTYEHLARRIGEAIHRSFKGDLKLLYSEDEKFIRVHWKRD
jgi:hypothetical protein